MGSEVVVAGDADTKTIQRRDTASEIERRMSKEGHTVVALHSDLEAHVRDQVIDSFRSNAAKVLITTNVLARGIDVSSVSIVINYVRINRNLSPHVAPSPFGPRTFAADAL